MARVFTGGRDERVLEDPVPHFVTNEHGYFAYADSGLSLTIVRAHSFQTPITDPENYPSYLWVESVNGFYLLRQEVLEGAPQPWVIVREVLPEEPHNFFYEFLAVLEDYARSLEA